VPIKNDEHTANQHASDPANPALWLLDCLDNGLWLGSEKFEGKYSPGDDAPHKLLKGALGIDESGAKLLPAFLEGSYRAWAATLRHAQPTGTAAFWKLLTGFGFEARQSNSRRIRIVPGADELRAKVCEHLGIKDAAVEDEHARPKKQPNWERWVQ
jgi:hypothetical protein